MEALLVRLGNLEHYQIAALASYLLYQGCYIGIIPEELIIATLGLLWSEGKIGFLEALVAVWVGLLSANATTVFFGSYFGPRILKIRPFCWVLSQEAVDDYLWELKKYGNWIIFLTRFTPVVRGPVYMAAGLSQMGMWRFFRTDALASCIQVPALLLLGRYFGRTSASMMDGYKSLGIAMGGLLVFGLVVKTFMTRRRRRVISG
ncbi:MAG: DedA family protein [Bdellovibrio sp.]|nr:DedA family protein [Bdellovibrio sp.]